MIRYAIIGGGLSGIMTATYLLRNRKEKIEIVLFEKNFKRIFKGHAYSSSLPHQLLNVPVKNMSLYQEISEHFYNWLKKNNFDYEYDDFVPRDIYGQYISSTFHDEIDKAYPGKLNIEHDSVIDITNNKNNSFEVKTSKGKIFSTFRNIFICTGNELPVNLLNFKSSKYLHNPWDGEGIQNIPSDKDILIIGSGLTMVDQVLSLDKLNHKGKYIVISRRGLLPLSHGSVFDYTFSVIPDFKKVRITDIFRWLRTETEIAKNKGIHWRSVMDALRTYTPIIWQSLSDKDKQSFYNHLMCYWDIHRHRIPAESYKRIHELIEQGQLKVIAGKLKGYTENHNKLIVDIKPRGQNCIDSISVDFVINCTGPSSPVKSKDNDLFNNLLRRGVLVSDNLKIGIQVNSIGNPVDSSGNINKQLFVIGPPAKGTFFEHSALREIRKQVHEIAGVNQTIHKL